ncbi:MAG: DUF2993 domain-containing protein [Anaerolineae bacterium]|nr:DUF2993 domain-containing protein [Anaerolineae bacterium]
MKNLTVGCTSALVGFVIGVVLGLGASSLLGRTESSAPITPVMSTSRNDMTIIVSASYLNTQLQQLVKQTGLAKQAALTLTAPNIAQINVTIETRMMGQTVTGNVSARMRVAVQSGRVVLTIEKVDTGNVNIPQTLFAPILDQVRTQAEDQINRIIQHELQGTGLRLANVRIAPNEVTLDLTAQ